MTRVEVLIKAIQKRKLNTSTSATMGIHGLGPYLRKVGRWAFRKTRHTEGALEQLDLAGKRVGVDVPIFAWKVTAFSLPQFLLSPDLSSLNKGWMCTTPSLSCMKHC
jgi:hypothetical protein